MPIALPPVLALIVAVGCGGGPAAVAPTNRVTPTAAVRDTATPTSSAATAPTAAASPSGLLAVALTDVLSGEAFTLGQFQGKVTIAQHMAVW
jgi:hypothetical protein